MKMAMLIECMELLVPLRRWIIRSRRRRQRKSYVTININPDPDSLLNIRASRFDLNDFPFMAEYEFSSRTCHNNSLHPSTSSANLVDCPHFHPLHQLLISNYYDYELESKRIWSLFRYLPMSPSIDSKAKASCLPSTFQPWSLLLLHISFNWKGHNTRYYYGL